MGSPYGANEDCTITVKESVAVPIVVESFRTENRYDKLSVNGVEYSGSRGPDGIIPNGLITWSSDYSVQTDGWKLCPSETTATSTLAASTTTTTTPTTTTTTTTTSTTSNSNTLVWELNEGSDCTQDTNFCVMTN